MPAESHNEKELPRGRQDHKLLLAGASAGVSQHSGQCLRALRTAKVAHRNARFVDVFFLVLNPATLSPMELKKKHHFFLCLSLRASQQGPAAAVHPRDVDEDVRVWPADLFHGAVQPLRLLCGVRRHPRDTACGDGGHPAHRHLRAPLHPTAQDIQDDSVIGARVQ